MGAPLIVKPAELELFSSLGSKPPSPKAMLATLVNDVPGGVSAGTCNTSVKFTVAPVGKDAAVHVIVPPEPTVGVVQGENMPAPVVTLRDTNVNPAGMTSVKVTLAASSRPPLTT
jgi:hypothetical protein